MLEKNANLLQDDTDKNLLIEGHCDQRGTQAYNIVLGKKRAIAIRDYLVALGVESDKTLGGHLWERETLLHRFDRILLPRKPPWTSHCAVTFKHSEN